MASTVNYNPADLNLKHTTGTWAYVTTSNLTTFDHTDAAETSIVLIPIPRSNLGEWTQDALKKITVTYTVVTTSITSAPTAVLNRNSWVASTGVYTRAAVTQAVTYGGADTTGTAAGAGAAGTHTAIVTIAGADVLSRTDLRNYTLELSFVCASGSVVKITGASIDFV